MLKLNKNNPIHFTKNVLREKRIYSMKSCILKKKNLHLQFLPIFIYICHTR